MAYMFCLTVGQWSTHRYRQGEAEEIVRGKHLGKALSRKEGGKAAHPAFPGSCTPFLREEPLCWYSRGKNQHVILFLQLYYQLMNPITGLVNLFYT